ncbi:MAG: hypothetical protein ABIG93_05270 [archaeon]
MRKVLNIMALFAVIGLLLSSVVIAGNLSDDLEFRSIEVNGNDVDFGNDSSAEIVAVEEGETLEVEIGLEASVDVEDIEVQVEIDGYEYSDYESLRDESHLFDMNEGTTKYVNLEIDLPVRLEKDEYWLRITVTDKNSNSMDEVVRLSVEPSRHGIDIEDVVLSPGSTVEAGRSLLATVQLQNYGDKDEEDVKVTISIDDLGISSTDYIEVVESDVDVSYETSEELFLSIPDCAAAGEYTLDVTAEYDEFESVSKSYSLTVTEGSYCDTEDERLVVAVGPESQSVKTGQQAVYALALSNEGTSTETYTMALTAGDWATESLSDSLVVLAPGESQVVYAYLDVAEDAAGGTQVASLVLSNEGQVLETITLSADVSASEDSGSTDFSLRNGLEIALIVLVVLLVIIGLIIGFTRLRKDEDEEEQTYY